MIGCFLFCVRKRRWAWTKRFSGWLFICTRRASPSFASCFLKGISIIAFKATFVVDCKSPFPDSVLGGFFPFLSDSSIA